MILGLIGYRPLVTTGKSILFPFMGDTAQNCWSFLDDSVGPQDLGHLDSINPWKGTKIIYPLGSATSAFKY